FRAAPLQPPTTSGDLQRSWHTGFYQERVVLLQLIHLAAQALQFGPLGRLQGLVPVDLGRVDPASFVFDPLEGNPLLPEPAPSNRSVKQPTASLTSADEVAELSANVIASMTILAMLVEG
ncbi:hypothetical protein, partial [Amycolatopsis panacis]